MNGYLISAVLATLAFTLIHSTAGVRLSYKYYYGVNLAKDGFQPQVGAITSLKLKSGLVLKKSTVVRDEESTHENEELVPGGEVKGYVWYNLKVSVGSSLFDDKNPVDSAKSLELEWVSGDNKDGEIKVDSVILINTASSAFASTSSEPYHEMVNSAKAFCTDKPIKSGKSATLKECTAEKMQEIKAKATELARHPEYKVTEY